MSDDENVLSLPPIPSLPPTSVEYKIRTARMFHATAASEFEAHRPEWVNTTLVNLLIAVDYLIEAEEARLAGQQR